MISNDYYTYPVVIETFFKVLHFVTNQKHVVINTIAHSDTAIAGAWCRLGENMLNKGSKVFN